MTNEHLLSYLRLSHPTLPESSIVNMADMMNVNGDEQGRAGIMRRVVGRVEATAGVPGKFLRVYENDICRGQTRQVLERLAMDIMALGKEIDRTTNGGNPFILHCLVLSHIQSAEWDD